MKNKEKNIIISVSWGIGDFIWATSAISLIKNYDGNIKITLLSFPQYFELIEKTNLIDDFIPFNRKFLMSKFKIVRYTYKIYFILKNFLKIKKSSSIIFLDYDPFFMKISSKVYKIKNIYGMDLMGFGYNLPIEDINYLTHIIRMPKDMDRFHNIVKYQTIIRSIFPTYNLALPVLNDTSYLKESLLEKFLQNTKKYKIVLCTKGSTSWRYYPTEHCIKLIEMINEKYDATFFIIGNDQEQIDVANEIKNNLRSIDIRNTCGKTNLLEYKELINQMDLLISIDSSAVHFAALSNIPTISLHGQTKPERSIAVNSNVIPICTNETCSPCDKERFYDMTICTYPKCMYNITPEMIFEKVEEILK